MDTNKKRLLAAALEIKQKKDLTKRFDPFKIGSAPTEAQLDVMKDVQKINYRYVRGGNRSGKSSIPAREITWLLTDSHPYFTRPKKWGSAPWLILVAGKSRQGMDTELWGNKIRPFLDDPTNKVWKERRSGGALTEVYNINTEDKIVFLTHADSSDKILGNLQMYTAHYVWVDEMPRKKEVLEELQRRTDSSQGPFIATFTPKVRNVDIQKLIDSAKAPAAKSYRLSKLDNPDFADNLQLELDKLEGLSENAKNTILYGEWTLGDDAVYDVDYDKMVAPLPSTYSPSWRHVESNDPSMNNTGFTLWAEDPASHIWYCVKAEYIQNIRDPVQLVQICSKLCTGYNIIRRITDPHEKWFISTASSEKVSPFYISPVDKTVSRKKDLIKGLQAALNDGKVKLTPHSTLLLDELNSCQWNSTGERIINASSYHLLDTAQYFVDLKPKSTSIRPTQTYADYLLDLNQKRKEKEEKTRQKIIRKSKWRRWR